MRRLTVADDVYALLADVQAALRDCHAAEWADDRNAVLRVALKDELTLLNDQIDERDRMEGRGDGKDTDSVS